MLLEVKAVALLGIATVWSILQVGDNDPWTLVWRVFLAALFTAISAMIGFLYRDLRAWIARNEKEQNDRYDRMSQVQTERYKDLASTILDLAQKQQRMIGILAMIPVMVGKPVGVEDMFRYVQEIQKVLEK